MSRTEYEQYKYQNMNEQIHKLELINLSLNENIDSYSALLEDDENVEEIKDLMLDFFLATRMNANLLYNSLEDLRKLNTASLNSNRTPEQYIKPLSDIEFKKQLLSHRY